MFRAIVVVLGRNEERKGNSKRKCVGKDASAGHPWLGRACGRPLCILVEKPKHFPIYYILPGTAQVKKNHLIPQRWLKVSYVNCHSVQQQNYRSATKAL